MLCWYVIDSSCRLPGKKSTCCETCQRDVIQVLLTWRAPTDTILRLKVMNLNRVICFCLIRILNRVEETVIPGKPIDNTNVADQSFSGKWAHSRCKIGKKVEVRNFSKTLIFIRYYIRETTYQKIAHRKSFISILLQLQYTTCRW